MRGHVKADKIFSINSSLHTCEPSELNSASTKKSASVIMVSRSTSSYKIEIFRNEYLLYGEKSHINVNIGTLY